MIRAWLRGFHRASKREPVARNEASEGGRPTGWVVDLRNWKALKDGHVDGAVIVDAEQWEAELHGFLEQGPVYVMADDPDCAQRVVVRLTALGWTAKVAPVLSEMVERGWPERVPHEKSPVRVGQQVRVEVDKAPGPGPLIGRVQDVRWGDLDFVYTVRVRMQDGSSVRLENLAEESITAVGGRGLPS